jgi:hypothetical protein
VFSVDIKVTYFLESVQSAVKYASAALGFTETWYQSSNAIGTLDDSLMSKDVNTYVELRLPTLPPVYRMSYIRVSDEHNPRNFKILALDNQSGFAKVEATSGGQPIGLYGQVQCALLIDFVRLGGVAPDHANHRKFLMRGLPVDVIDGNVVKPAGPNWNSIQVFLNWLADKETGHPAKGLPKGIVPNTTLGLRYHNPAVAWTPVLALSTDANSKYLLDLVPQVTPPDPLHNLYEIRDVPEPLKRLNRIWTWKANNNVATPPYSIMGQMKTPLGTDVFAGPGAARVRLVSWLYALFSQYTIIGLRSKRTGRLFHQLRGRSPNRG